MGGLSDNAIGITIIVAATLAVVLWCVNKIRTLGGKG